MNLESVRERAALFLMDANRLVWPDTVLDEAVRHALEDYSRACPQVRSCETAAGADGTLGLSGLAGFSGLLALRYPLEGENSLRGWALRQMDGIISAVLLNSPFPQPGAMVGVIYTAAHTLAGLDGAAVTSAASLHAGLLARGAAAYAAQMRCIDRAEGFLPVDGAQHLAQWAEGQMNAYKTALRELGMPMVYNGEPTGGWGEV